MDTFVGVIHYITVFNGDSEYAPNKTFPIFLPLMLRAQVIC